jgi:hypothetical protein
MFGMAASYYIENLKRIKADLKQYKASVLKATTYIKTSFCRVVI